MPVNQRLADRLVADLTALVDSGDTQTLAAVLDALIQKLDSSSARGGGMLNVGRAIRARRALRADGGFPPGG